MTFTQIYWSIAGPILGFITIGLILLQPIHRWLVKHRWAIDKGEMQ